MNSNAWIDRSLDCGDAVSAACWQVMPHMDFMVECRGDGTFRADVGNIGAGDRAFENGGGVGGGYAFTSNQRMNVEAPGTGRGYNRNRCRLPYTRLQYLLGPCIAGNPVWWDYAQVTRARLGLGYWGWVLTVGDSLCRYAVRPLLGERADFGDLVPYVVEDGVLVPDSNRVVERYADYA